MWAIDSIQDHVQGFVGSINGLALVPPDQRTPEGDAAWVEEWKKLGGVAEKRLAAHGKKYIAGTDKMTLADFNVCAPFFAMVYNDGAFCAGPLVEQVKSALQNDMPHLKRYLETTMKNELQAKYLNKRPSRPF